jgi:hypothetical protein
MRRRAFSSFASLHHLPYLRSIASIVELEMSQRWPAPDWRPVRRLDRLRARSHAFQARVNIGDFSVDLAKAACDGVQSIAASPHFLGAPRALEFEKTNAQIGFVGGYLYVRAPGQRSQIGKSA